MRHDQARIRNAEIVRRVAAGEFPKDLANEYGLVPQYVILLARTAGVMVDSKRQKKEGVLKRRAIVAELHSLGLSGGQSIALLGVSRPTFYKDAHDLGLKFPYDTSNCAGVHSASVESERRADRMAAMYRSGMTLHQIGEKFGISRERVRQVMTRNLGITQKDGGKTKRSEVRRARRAAQRDAEYLASHGCTWDQYKEVREIGRAMVAQGIGIYRTPLRAFISQQNNAKNRGISWGLNFWQWWTIWQESGKWEERGRAKDSFVMCRHRDEGGYEIGNVFIGTLSENSSDQPNNPFRIDHPDHAAVVAARAVRMGLLPPDQRPPKERRVRKKREPHLPAGVRRARTTNRFTACATVGGRDYHFGTFDTPEEAYQARLRGIEALKTSLQQEAA